MADGTEALASEPAPADTPAFTDVGGSESWGRVTLVAQDLEGSGAIGADHGAGRRQLVVYRLGQAGAGLDGRATATAADAARLLTSWVDCWVNEAMPSMAAFEPASTAAFIPGAGLLQLGRAGVDEDAGLGLDVGVGRREGADGLVVGHLRGAQVVVGLRTELATTSIRVGGVGGELHASTAVQTKTSEAGVDAFLTKPVSKEALADVFGPWIT